MDTTQTSEPTTTLAATEGSSPLNLLGEQGAGACCGGSGCCASSQ